MTQYSADQVKADLAALRTAITTGTGGKIRLGKGPVPQGPSHDATEFAALVCTFDGYADVAVTSALSVYEDGHNTWSFQIPTVQFNYVAPGSGTPVTEIATFVWVEDAAGNLVRWHDLPGGVSFDHNGCSLPVDEKFSKSANPSL